MAPFRPGHRFLGDMSRLRAQADESFRKGLCEILSTDDDGLDDMIKNGDGEEFDLQEVWQSGEKTALVS